MKLLLRLIFFVSISGFFSPAGAIEPFQIKGLRLGESPAAACGAAQVTSRLDDIIRKYKASVPELVATGTNECKISAANFGGLDIDGNIDLLFLAGHLIQVKFSLMPMHWMKYGEIFSPLEQMYGPPTITKVAPFTTHTWRQAETTLSASRADNPSGVESLEIILRDEAGFKTYEERSETDRRILEQLGSNHVQESIRN